MIRTAMQIAGLLNANAADHSKDGNRDDRIRLSRGNARRSPDGTIFSSNGPVHRTSRRCFTQIGGGPPSFTLPHSSLRALLSPSQRL